MRVFQGGIRAGVVFVLACSCSGALLATPSPSSYYTITPCRIYDTRDGDGAFSPDEQREIQVTSLCGIPADAVAVAANLTTISATADGSFSAFPDPLSPAATNAVTFRSGYTRASDGVYALNGNGQGTLSLQARMPAGQVDLAVDVVGYFRESSTTPLATETICSPGGNVQAADCWEGRVTLNGGTATHQTAYHDVRIRIDFKKNGTFSHSTYAYWDGERTFTFRTAFPSPGPWTWEVKNPCENCLGGTPSPMMGSVTVSAKRTTPVLYARGPLMVDASKRFLKHDNGTKFFWLGDTAWAAPMRTSKVAGSASTWTTYLTDRTTRPIGTTPPASVPTAGRYTVIQLSLAFHVGAGGYTACTDPDTLEGRQCKQNAKRAAFTTTGALSMVPNATSRWNPAYWRNLDRLVAQANEKGLVVVLTGVMDPFGLNEYAPELELRTFARNLAARMAGFFVIYSVGWDNRAESATYTCGGDGAQFVVGEFNRSVVNSFAQNTLVVSRMKAVGSELEAFPGEQLITTHLGGGTPFFGADNYFHDPGATGQNQPLASAYSYFHREPWLDFHLFQSSQCNPKRASVFQHQGTGTPGATCSTWVGESQLSCIMRRARMMPAKFLSLKANDSPLAGSPTVKPVANGEAHYEKTVLAGNPQPEPDIAYQSRHAGHVTTLSGAFGFTGGVVNVAEWRWPGDGMGITGPQSGKSPGQLKYLSLFQEGQVMEWERLRRKELMLKNAGTNENERSVVAASESNQYIVAYLPHRTPPPGQPEADTTLKLAINQGIYKEFGSKPCRWAKTWWNPFNGRVRPVQPSEITTQSRPCATGEPTPCLTFTFGAPECEGPVETRPDGRCDWVLLLDDLINCPSNSADTQIWSGLDPETGQWGLYSQGKDSAGQLVGAPAQMAEPSEDVQAAVKIANGPAQGALMVWTAEGADEEGFGILARMLDDEGLPAGPVFAVNEKGAGDQMDPSVAALGASKYIVTWTSYSDDGDQGEVYARYVDRDGNPLGDEFQVNITTAGRQGAAQVASDPQGYDVLIAWESWDQDGDGNGVFARRFDYAGLPSEEFQIHQAGADWQYLTRVQTDAEGKFEVHWQVFTQYGTDLGTYGRRINPTGVPWIGEQFVVAPPEGGVGD